MQEVEQLLDYLRSEILISKPLLVVIRFTNVENKEVRWFGRLDSLAVGSEGQVKIVTIAVGNRTFEFPAGKITQIRPVTVDEMMAAANDAYVPLPLGEDTGDDDDATPSPAPVASGRAYHS